MPDRQDVDGEQGARKKIDNIEIYRRALEHLSATADQSSPEALTLKHRAVLALARLGSTDFAQSEYERYELSKVSGHEDIMALAGRLAKDRYISSGDIEDARDSANFYEAAFQNTGGYFSGINAATMSLIAEVPSEIVLGRARAVLTRLSSIDGESAKDRYYINATRAEAQYILGDMHAAQSSLQTAMSFDPLNYTAHASTYRQLRLLSNAKGAVPQWLEVLRPPKAVHFAGHLFGHIDDEAQLAIALSDIIQSEDIGFGYGALAAGSDIIFAESLLEEGGELHVVLPVNRDLFCAHSVAPLGKDWVTRFEACLERAASLQVVTDWDDWPEASLNNYTARVAMGLACARASELSTQAEQVLICEDVQGLSLTAQHAKDWSSTAENASSKRAQIIVDFPGGRPSPIKQSQSDGVRNAKKYDVKIGLAKNGEFISVFDDPLKAMDAAKAEVDKTMQAVGGVSCGLHIAALSRQAESESSLRLNCKILSNAQLPGSVLVSEDLAAILALEAPDKWETGFMGWIEEDKISVAAYFAKPIAG